MHGAFVRDRAHRFLGRRNASKVLYDEGEIANRPPGASALLDHLAVLLGGDPTGAS